MLKNEPSVWIANGIGITLSSLYFMNYLKYSPKQSPTLPGSTRMHIQACLTTILTTLSIAAVLPKLKATKVIGNLGVAFCIALFASPLVALRTVIQEKSAESIPLSFTFASIICCVLWSVVGLGIMKDFAIYFPNLLGLSFGLIQLGLKLKYGNGNSSAAHFAI